MNLGLPCPRPGTPILGTLGLQCPLAEKPGLESVMRIRTRGFSPRVFLACLRKITRSRPAAENAQKRTVSTRRKPRWAFESAMSPSGKHRFSTLWACSFSLREHQASGARCEVEPAVSRLGSSSIAGGNSLEAALTWPPEKETKTDVAYSSEAALGIWVCNVPRLGTSILGTWGL